MWIAMMCLLVGYFGGVVAGEIRVKTFWGGFIVSTIALCASIAAAYPLWSIAT